MNRRFNASIAVALSLTACGADDQSPAPAVCPDLAGTYTVTTEIVSTTCSLGLHAITQPIAYTFTQSAPSCAFTMTNGVYPGSTYAGRFTVNGGRVSVTWDSVNPPPTVAGYALSYTGESLTIAPATGTLSGSFSWHSAAGCDGTTNVCNDAVPAGCLTPR